MSNAAGALNNVLSGKARCEQSSQVTAPAILLN